MCDPALPQRLRADTVALTRELIARASLTPDDAGCQALMASRLAPLGLRSSSLVSTASPMCGFAAAAARPLVCFAGHTDVVPTGPPTEWHSDPFAPTDRDGFSTVAAPPT